MKINDFLKGEKGYRNKNLESRSKNLEFRKLKNENGNVKGNESLTCTRSNC